MSIPRSPRRAANHPEPEPASRTFFPANRAARASITSAVTRQNPISARKRLRCANNDSAWSEHSHNSPDGYSLAGRPGGSDGALFAASNTSGIPVASVIIDRGTWIVAFALPDSLHAVFRKHGVCGNDRQFLLYRLGNKQPVKRVTMVKSQSGDPRHMTKIDVQLAEPIGRE